MCGGDAALCQITLTTLLLIYLLWLQYSNKHVLLLVLVLLLLLLLLGFIMVALWNRADHYIYSAKKLRRVLETLCGAFQRRSRVRL